jgi:hypothetical protein
MDRRTTIKWVLAASATMPLFGTDVAAQSSTVLAQPKGTDTNAIHYDNGYGTDPNLTKTYRPGEVWPLTFTPEQRRTATVLCDLIIPPDEVSPSASSVGVVDFIDEWVSSPYPRQRGHRPLLLEGLQWLDDEAMKRSKKSFVDADAAAQHSICGDICYEAGAAPEFAQAAKFFASFRDLTAGGFYTTPIGMKDIGYVGNVPLSSFPPPPLKLLQQLGLRPTLK